MKIWIMNYFKKDVFMLSKAGCDVETQFVRLSVDNEQTGLSDETTDVDQESKRTMSPTLDSVNNETAKSGQVSSLATATGLILEYMTSRYKI